MGKKERILVVEDNRTLLETLALATYHFLETG
jgi:hypothetical protein